MTFYFDYLCTETFAKERNDLLFVGGAMTFLLKELAGQVCTHSYAAANVCLSQFLYHM